MSQRFLIGLAALSLAAACHEKTQSSVATAVPDQGGTYATASPSGDQGGISCPMAVPGTQVFVRPLSDAIALDFVTTGDVHQVRQGVRQLARAQNSTTIAPEPDGASQGSGGREMQPEIGAAEVQSQVSDLENGERVLFTPRDPGQLGALQDQVQVQASRLSMGDCAGIAINGISLSRGMKANLIPPGTITTSPDDGSTP